MALAPCLSVGTGNVGFPMGFPDVIYRLCHEFISNVLAAQSRIDNGVVDSNNTGSLQREINFGGDSAVIVHKTNFVRTGVGFHFRRLLLFVFTSNDIYCFSIKGMADRVCCKTNENIRNK
jgi:hypothetical protein